MLLELSIKNFAIIDDLHMTFSRGLTIMSGETGAGKSIILNAVNLLLGSRASERLIREKSDFAELTALFSIDPDGPAAEELAARGDAPEDGLLIRRVISRTNRHRIYVNSRPASMHLLQKLTKNLAGISGQHAHQGLLDEAQHLQILDRFGGLSRRRKAVSGQFHRVIPLIERLKNRIALKDHQTEQAQLLEFQRAEIVNAAIGEGEDDALETERRRLKHAKTLASETGAALSLLYDADGAVTERLAEVKNRLERASEMDESLAPHARTLEDLLFKAEDVVTELRSYVNGIEMDDGRLEIVEDRLEVMGRLKRKYGKSLADVMAYLEKIEEELADIGDLSGAIKQIEADLAEASEKMIKAARKLSGLRQRAAARLSRQVEAELKTLNMDGTRFAVHVAPVSATADTPAALIDNGSAVSETGMDRAHLLIAPNVGEGLKPLADIASGGELSRIVLTIKVILARTDTVQTLIFDEADAGIGGATAEVVGRKLADLAEHHQVICITHLPQIARFGDHHYHIAKHVKKGRTITSISPLSDEERVVELARMLGGEEITPAVIKYARELTTRRKRSKGSLQLS